MKLAWAMEMNTTKLLQNHEETYLIHPDTLSNLRKLFNGCDSNHRLSYLLEIRNWDYVFHVERRVNLR